jgi:uncharacterized protein YndB with AHSA1/START domain
MSSMEGEVLIAAPIDRVFAYATNPDTWVNWYPLTTGVEWGQDRPAVAGETWTEHVEMYLGATGLPLWKGDFHWRVTRSDRPRQFAYQGYAEAAGLLKGTSGGTAEIVYTFSETPDATRFHRLLTYTEPNLALEVLDALVFRHIIQHASEQALANMKRLLEPQADAVTAAS